MIALVEQEEDFQFPLPVSILKARRSSSVLNAALGHNLSTGTRNPSYLTQFSFILRFKISSAFQ